MSAKKDDHSTKEKTDHEEHLTLSDRVERLEHQVAELMQSAAADRASSRNRQGSAIRNIPRIT